MPGNDAAMAATTTTTMPPVHLDGKTLEGGGQLLRLALSLSCLTGRAIRVTDIRGNRPRGRGKKAVQGGGLKGSHAECARWLARATNADVAGLEVGSSELTFRPRLSAGGAVGGGSSSSSSGPSSFSIDAVLDAVMMVETVTTTTTTTTTTQDGDGQLAGAASDAKGADVGAAGKKDSVRPRQLRIVQKTPGAVYLIVQALLPYLMFGPCCRARPGEEEVPEVILQIVGGTNVSASPSHEYTTQVLLPTLMEFVGLPHVEAKLVRRGWSLSPSVGGRSSSLGEIILKFKPLSLRAPLPAFDLTANRRGDLLGFDVSVIASPAELLDGLEEKVCTELRSRFPEAPVTTVIKEDSVKKNRVYVLVVAKFSDQRSGGTKTHRLGRDALFDGRESSAGKGLAVQIAKSVVRDIASEVAHGGCVDEHLQDQLVVFQALAKGRSRVDRGDAEPSLHTQTAIWVAEQMLDGLVAFKGNGRCDGAGLLADADVL